MIRNGATVLPALNDCLGNLVGRGNAIGGAEAGM